jgi:hypothetical protein
MKCEDCLAIIEEYFDAELNEQESAKVAEHLTACGICNEVYQALEQEQQVYAHYQRDVEVSPALWQAVQAGIKQQAAIEERAQPESLMGRLRRFFTETFQAPRFSPALAAMLVVVAVGATVLVMNYVNSQSTPTMIGEANKNGNGSSPAKSGNDNQTPQAGPGEIAGNKNSAPEVNPKIAPVPAPEKEAVVKANPVNTPKSYATNLPAAVNTKVEGSQPRVTAEALLRDAEQKYIKAIALLQRDFDKRRSKLDPQLVAKLDASLASIDRTIAETRNAVRKNSDDPIALQYMLTAYAKKVEVLRDITAD